MNSFESEPFILSENIVQTKVDQHFATYHRLLGGLFFLDEAGQELLNTYRKPRNVPASLLSGEASTRADELTQQLIARHILVPARGQQLPAGPSVVEKKINIIQLILANACNFGCTYCFEGVQGKEMSAEDEYNKVDTSRLIAREGIKVNIEDSIYASKERFDHQYDPKNRSMKPADGIAYVESALAVARSEGVVEVMLQFFGGEPLLNWRTIQAVLERFGNGEREGIKIHYSTVTNGSLITEEVARTFAQYQVAVCVSFDSPTSPSRPLKNGDDSTPVVMQGLRTLQR